MSGFEYNEFNNTGTRMLDSINHMTLKLYSEKQLKDIKIILTI